MPLSVKYIKLLNCNQKNTNEIIKNFSNNINLRLYKHIICKNIPNTNINKKTKKLKSILKTLEKY